MIRLIIVVFMFTFSLSSIACQLWEEDLDNLAKNDAEYLSQYSCTTVHLTLDQLLRSGDTQAVINHAENFEEKGIRDRFVITKKALAYAKQNKYQLAILAEREALSANYICQHTIPCYGLYNKAMAQYRIASHYSKLDKPDEQFKALQLADVYFLKSFLAEQGIRFEKLLSEPELIREYKERFHSYEFESENQELD